MTILRRGTAVLGSLLLAASFFLPPGFYNSPAARFSWSREAVFPFPSGGESLVFIAVCVAIVYPYLWALVAAVGLLHFPGGEKPAWRSQFICHLLGGVVVAALGLTLLILRDTYTPRPLQWILTLVPVGFLAVFLTAARLLGPGRRLPALTALGLAVFTPPQVVLGRLVELDGGEGWGYFLGAAGGILGFLGCLGILAATKKRAAARPER